MNNFRHTLHAQLSTPLKANSHSYLHISSTSTAVLRISEVEMTLE